MSEDVGQQLVLDAVHLFEERGVGAEIVLEKRLQAVLVGCCCDLLEDVDYVVLVVSVEAADLVYSEFVVAVELTGPFRASEVPLVQFSQFIGRKAVQIGQQHSLLILLLLLPLGLRLQLILGAVDVEAILLLERLFFIENKQFYLFIDLPIIDILVIVGLFVYL